MEGGLGINTWVNFEYPIHVEAVGRTQEIYAWHPIDIFFQNIRRYISDISDISVKSKYRYIRDYRYFLPCRYFISADVTFFEDSPFFSTTSESLPVSEVLPIPIVSPPDAMPPRPLQVYHRRPRVVAPLPFPEAPADSLPIPSASPAPALPSPNDLPIAVRKGFSPFFLSLSQHGIRAKGENLIFFSV
ncbi:hypothetical protein CK203_093021 [Vitis vinifera]|uniref:Uncharacterized protein n=1 Tax=Vitis vinifera TaxID=29760 RepID=A0A438CLF2_VITVI|nr:hypothetical protein CK203_093021 [Vitis vinifera]